MKLQKRKSVFVLFIFFFSLSIFSSTQAKTDGVLSGAPADLHTDFRGENFSSPLLFPVFICLAPRSNCTSSKKKEKDIINHKELPGKYAMCLCVCVWPTCSKTCSFPSFFPFLARPHLMTLTSGHCYRCCCRFCCCCGALILAHDPRSIL